MKKNTLQISDGSEDVAVKEEPVGAFTGTGAQSAFLMVMLLSLYT